jgi:hypothetical protein
MNRLFIKFSIFCNLFILILFCRILAQNNPPEINNVSAVVDTQNLVVIITYDLLDTEQDTMFVTLKISSDSGQTYIFPVDSVVGDVGYPVISGIEKQMSWYYNPETVNFTINSSNIFRVKIVADDLYKIEIKEIVDQIDSLNLKSDLDFVEGIRHRTTGFNHLEETKNLIENRFVQKNLQVSRHEFMYGNYGAANIIGRLPGQTEEEITFIIDGHFDTVSNSPGADDNGSAVVGMLEAMRVLATYNFKHTIKFIGFDLEEEEGRIGSARYVSESIPPYEQIDGVFNFEMIGYYSDEPGSQILPFGFNFFFPVFSDSVEAQDFRGNFIFNVANENSNSLKSQFDSCAKLYVPELRVISLAVADNGEIAPDLRRSDHAPFWDAGYMGLMLSDGGNFRNTNYHSPSDTIGTLNFSFMNNVVKATVATVAKLAELIHCGVGISDVIEISPTRVSISNSSTTGRFSLTRCYPNPFNSSAIISYTLPNTNSVTLKIFDTMGREIQTLVNELQNAGTYSVNFNSSKFSSGTYFYKLKIGKDFTETKKMLLIR